MVVVGFFAVQYQIHSEIYCKHPADKGNKARGCGKCWVCGGRTCWGGMCVRVPWGERRWVLGEEGGECQNSPFSLGWVKRQCRSVEAFVLFFFFLLFFLPMKP